jgi:DNA-binding transcriptional ArsR family regulator
MTERASDAGGKGERPAERVANPAASIEALKAKAPEVADFLRQLANPNRLLLLCHISQGERSVTEIQHDLGLKQPALSQQLAELRQSGLVETRRESRSIYYSIKDERTRAVILMLHAIFCAEDPAAAAQSLAQSPEKSPARAQARAMVASRAEPFRPPAGDAAAFARLDDHPATVDDRPHLGARS